MLNQWQMRQLESLDEWDQLEFLNQSDLANQKKQELLKIARRGEPRPTSGKHPLGVALSAYTNPKNESYNIAFDEEIRKLRPDWFMSRTFPKKQQLLMMARNGEPRPSIKHSLGGVLCRYVNPKSNCYDPMFEKEIRKLRPDWFVFKPELATRKKQQLLEMARNGKPKPVVNKHPLGLILTFYTNPNNLTYDPIFNKKIRKLRPDWFVSKYDIANQKKQQLLMMARNGEPRPIVNKHPLGVCLCHYTNPNSGSCDLIFNKKIRNLRPDWFSEYAKQQLLEMARNGKPKPRYDLGRILARYINPNSGSYDPVFEKEIRKLRPDWAASKPELKKQLLLEMARNGEPRPIPGKHLLGFVMYSYIYNKSKSYDSKFSKQIRRLRPDWFKVC